MTIEDSINKNKKPNYSTNNENIIKDTNENNINNNTEKNNNIENKPEKFSNIEDLVNYINGSDKKKRRKKKRRKKTKVQNSTHIPLIEETKEYNNNIIKDDVYENFKSNIIHFTNNLENVKKIKPKISEAFLEKLKSMN